MLLHHVHDKVRLLERWEVKSKLRSCGGRKRNRMGKTLRQGDGLGGKSH